MLNVENENAVFFSPIYYCITKHIWRKIKVEIGDKPKGGVPLICTSMSKSKTKDRMPYAPYI